MQRLTPVKDELIKHAAEAARLLETAEKAADAETRNIVSPKESLELFRSTLTDAAQELAEAIRLIAAAVPPPGETAQ